MTLRYGSVCSGIEAASVAWEPLGWKPVFFSEIEPFPCEVLAQRFGSNMPGQPHARNGVPNYGDMTHYKGWPDAALDVLVGGTPCQAFSIAGLRKGLDDPRGNLTLVFLGLVERHRPRWVVWENVPGVLSLDGGRAFAAFLSGLGQLGYGWAYRVLDAQFCRVDGYPRAVPQRRRRVFVVGHFGDWRRAAGVLLEPEGLRGDSAPRRKAGQGATHDVAPSLVSSGRGVERAGETRGQDAVVGVYGFGGGNTTGPIDAAACLTAKGQRIDFEVETLIAGPVVTDVAPALRAGGNVTGGDRPYGTDVDTCDSLVAHALRAEGFDASEDGTGRGTPLVPVTIAVNETVGAMCAESGPNTHGSRGVSGSQSLLSGYIQPVAFDMRGREGGAQFEGPHETANIRAANGGSSRSYVADRWAVRRLTPTECERLQGFPDGWTAIERSTSRAIEPDMARYLSAKGLPVFTHDAGQIRTRIAADGPRYKALGNSMAVPVMRWIGQRIALMDEVSA